MYLPHKMRSSHAGLTAVTLLLAVCGAHLGAARFLSSQLEDRLRQGYERLISANNTEELIKTGGFQQILNLLGELDEPTNVSKQESISSSDERFVELTVTKPVTAIQQNNTPVWDESLTTSDNEVELTPPTQADAASVSSPTMQSISSETPRADRNSTTTEAVSEHDRPITTVPTTPRATTDVTNNADTMTPTATAPLTVRSIVESSATPSQDLTTSSADLTTLSSVEVAPIQSSTKKPNVVSPHRPVVLPNHDLVEGIETTTVKRVHVTAETSDVGVDSRSLRWKDDESLLQIRFNTKQLLNLLSVTNEEYLTIDVLAPSLYNVQSKVSN